MKSSFFHWPVISAPSPDESLSPLWRRLLWMAGIWAASVAALLMLAILLRWVLKS
jgi:hypothetical protein